MEEEEEEEEVQQGAREHEDTFGSSRYFRADLFIALVRSSLPPNPTSPSPMCVYVRLPGPLLCLHLSYSAKRSFGKTVTDPWRGVGRENTLCIFLFDGLAGNGGAGPDVTTAVV